MSHRSCLQKRAGKSPFALGCLCLRTQGTEATNSVPVCSWPSWLHLLHHLHQPFIILQIFSALGWVKCLLTSLPFPHSYSNRVEISPSNSSAHHNSWDRVWLQVVKAVGSILILLFTIPSPFFFSPGQIM